MQENLKVIAYEDRLFKSMQVIAKKKIEVQVIQEIIFNCIIWCALQIIVLISFRARLRSLKYDYKMHK